MQSTLSLSLLADAAVTGVDLVDDLTASDLKLWVAAAQRPADLAEQEEVPPALREELRVELAAAHKARAMGIAR